MHNFKINLWNVLNSLIMEKQRKKSRSDNVMDSNLEKLERKALLEQEKRKKPGECLKVFLK